MVLVIVVMLSTHPPDYDWNPGYVFESSKYRIQDSMISSAPITVSMFTSIRFVNSLLPVASM
jgi:hypothetical protein